MKEGGGMSEPGKAEYVCKPTPNNITGMFIISYHDMKS